MRPLRRTSTWSRLTRKSTSRSWRRTTTAWERAWGRCWRGRFPSCINPSSGLGWRTGKQAHRVKQPILLGQETHHWSFHHSVWLQRKVRTNGIEQRSIHSVRVTSTNIESWSGATGHRLSVGPMPGPNCNHVLLKTPRSLIALFHTIRFPSRFCSEFLVLSLWNHCRQGCVFSGGRCSMYNRK